MLVQVVSIFVSYLVSCDHVFCLHCIRNWRTNGDLYGRETVRVCPICRIESFLVCPLDRHIKTGPRKTEIINNYKAKLKLIPCRYYKSGTKTCPFSSSCLYSHQDLSGADESHKMTRHMMGADCEREVVQKYTLFDFIETKQKPRKKK